MAGELHWMSDYYKAYRDLVAPLAFWPFSDQEKADAQRDDLENLAWQRLYDTQIKPRLKWIGRE